MFGYMPSVKIHELTPNDTGAIAGLEADCFTAAWNAADLSPLIADVNNICLAAMVNASVAGYIICQCVAGEMEIHRLAVKKEFRRMGIAEKLLSSALDKAVEGKIRDVFLEVSSSNEPAINLYRKLGFEASYTRKKYYAHSQDDAVVMNMAL
jgi:ribosomal-protein-alanine N-acetyltransferase